MTIEIEGKVIDKATQAGIDADITLIIDGTVEATFSSDAEAGFSYRGEIAGERGKTLLLRVESGGYQLREISQVFEGEPITNLEVFLARETQAPPAQKKWVKPAAIGGVVVLVAVVVWIAWPPSPPAKKERPDLYVSEFSLRPAKPRAGQEVAVRVGTYNKGTAKAGPYTVEWWPGENYPEPACTWRVEGSNAGGGRIHKCTYDGYPSRYSRITTKVVIRPKSAANEMNTKNNTKRMTIEVRDRR